MLQTIGADGARTGQLKKKRHSLFNCLPHRKSNYTVYAARRVLALEAASRSISVGVIVRY